MRDILINDDGDIIIQNGDFATGDSDEQQVQMILASVAGQWKEHPECGAALQFSQNGRIDRFMERNIRVQLQADGFNVEKLNIAETGISIDGDYGNI